MPEDSTELESFLQAATKAMELLPIGPSFPIKSLNRKLVEIYATETPKPTLTAKSLELMWESNDCTGFFEHNLTPARIAEWGRGCHAWRIPFWANLVGRWIAGNATGAALLKTLVEGKEGAGIFKASAVSEGTVHGALERATKEWNQRKDRLFEV